jgi:hypothetical protein
VQVTLRGAGSCGQAASAFCSRGMPGGIGRSPCIMRQPRPALRSANLIYKFATGL